MESPSRALSLASPSTTPHHSLSSRRRRISRTDSPINSVNSPEFEFWNLRRNPSAFPDPAALHSADELFSDGVILPLHLLPNRLDPDPEPESEPGPSPEPEESNTAGSASITCTTGNPILSASKRWKEIFKRGDKEKEKEKKTPEKSMATKRREKKTGSASTGNGNNVNNNGGSNNGSNNSAELNINIWPFSRSRSAGNNSGRSKPASGSTNRKVSSAPCSRSNSSGDSKSRRSWPSSPGRAGVHVGRSSPVWQVRRNRTNGGSSRVLNVPMCIGYRQHLGCRSDENAAVGSGDGGGGGLARGGGGGDGSGGNGNLFSLRGLFSKKSVLTV